MNKLHPFHYAFKVKDIQSTRSFYIDLLGCSEGRSTEYWIDFNFFGNQLSAHISDRITALDYCGKVDGVSVPIPHFGCIVPIDTFKQISARLKSEGITFIIEPQLRYEGKTGEQYTMFFLDFSGNPIELKSYTKPNELFET